MNEKLKCITCKKEKFPTYFSNSKAKKNGKRSECKACNKVRHQERRKRINITGQPA